MLLALLATAALASPFDYEVGAPRLLGSARMGEACARAVTCVGGSDDVARVRAWCAAFTPGAPLDVEVPTRADVERVAALDPASPDCGVARELRLSGVVTERASSPLGTPTVASPLGTPTLTSPPAEVIDAPAQVGFSQADLLAGLSDRLIERAAGELIDWQLQRLTRQICAEDEDLPRILPASCELLALDGLLNTGLGLAMLQSALRQDATTLPRRIAEQQLEAAGASPEERGQALVLGVFARTTELLLAGNSPTNAMAAWAQARSWRREYEPMVVDGSLDPLIPVVAWALSTAVGSLSNEDGRVVLGRGSDPDEAARVAVLACIVNLREDGALERLMALSGAGDETARRLSIFNVLQAAILHYWASIEQSSPLVEQIRTASSAQDLAQLRRLYGMLVGQGMEDAGGSMAIAMQFSPSVETRLHLQGLRTLLDAMSASARDLARADYAAQAQDMLNLIFAVHPALRCQAGDGPCQSRIAPVLRTLSFLGSVAGASDPEAARGAIESLVAPDGGYARKRSPGARGFKGLNAYVGVGAGPEWALGPGGVSWEDAAPSIAPLVSVGFELSHPLGQKGWSGGIYFPVIDLGTLAAIRLDDASDSTPTDLNVRQVFSPGAYLVLGLPRAPITLGVGPTFAPALRTDGTNGTPLNALRFQAFLAMDLPLFP